MHQHHFHKFIGSVIVYFSLAGSVLSQDIPLPEHPRPDFQREQWINLNGWWNFRFDRENVGDRQQWYLEGQQFEKKIQVPFPWGSPLSGVSNESDIAWYSRKFAIPASWSGKCLYLIVGASDWRTTVWVDGNKLGDHQGGYTPFEFELKGISGDEKQHTLVIRVDDTPHDFKLEGKQGYGQAKGIWQTVYLEARGKLAISSMHFTPDIDQSKVNVNLVLNDIPGNDVSIRFHIKSGINGTLTAPKFKKGEKELQFDVPVANQHLWSLDDPFLYDVDLAVIRNGQEEDRVAGYFGMRKISVMNLPGYGYPYIALNNKPVYLQLTLDQSYHPEGFYTYPSDAFMRDEIIRSKKIGLNGNRLHIKVEVPRKLYWADKLGLLIMADVPNSWGEPGPDMRREWEYAMRGMIQRDYNHPAIFSWVIFNETWGLFSKPAHKQQVYADSTAAWVKKMYYAAKKLDPTRLVEDNSPCNNDHVISDINSWHAYLTGYQWKDFMKMVDENTYPGSAWNYRKPEVQSNAPMINSECGNVWGYEGSTGDVDWSYDYHRMMNEFRMHPKMGGWLYTEHHDVINEWNGYYRYDRSEKETGLGEIVPGMRLNDLHSSLYLSTGADICRLAAPNQELEIPLYASFMTDKQLGDSVFVCTRLYGWDQTGRYQEVSASYTAIPYRPWFNGLIANLRINMPCMPMFAILSITLEDASGTILQHNFTGFLVSNGPSERDEWNSRNDRNERLLRIAPSNYSAAEWSLKTHKVLDGLKVWGAGSGYFEYRIPWPAGLKASDIASASLVLEVSAKRLNGKDKDKGEQEDGDYMRGQGFHDPSLNPNSYPMTDGDKFPSMMQVSVNSYSAGQFYLEDDPADHRGMLSWFSQPENGKLDEAGSYGYLVHAWVPREALLSAEGKEIIIRLSVPTCYPGGLAIYGERFGRYPVDPTLVFDMK
jgi:hypothetical protein